MRQMSRILAPRLAAAAATAGVILSMGPALGAAQAEIRGGTLVTATNADPATLNSAYRYEVKGRPAIANLYNRLVGMSEVTSEVIPDLAERWDVSDDGRTYTFHLVKGVTWHDGKPFTAHDVKFTFDAMVARKGPGFSNFKEYLHGVEVVDDLTVRMTLTKPNSAFLTSVADPYGSTTIILPRHIFEGKNWDGLPQNDAPVGTGPFKFVEWRHGERIVLERNPAYFKKGLPYLDRIVIRVIPNAPTTVAALTAGEIHYSGEGSLSGLDFVRLQDHPGLVAAMTQGTLWHIAFNTKKPPFDNHKVRLAFAHAIDRADVAKKAEYGTVVVSNGAYTELVPWAFNKDAKLPSHDIATAKRLLDEAGFKPGANGIRMKLSWVASKGIGERIAQVVKEQLRQIGVDVDLRLVEFGTFTKIAIEARDFTITAMGGRQNPEPVDWHMFIQTGGYRNIYGYSNAEVDALLDKAIATTDLGQRAKSYFRVQEILVRDLPRLNLFTHTQKHIATRTFEGYFFEPDAGRHQSYHVLERVRRR